MYENLAVKRVAVESKRRQFLRQWRIEDCRKGYQWPASALTAVEMEKLTALRNSIKVPISDLLRAAVAHQNFIPLLKQKVQT